MWDGPALHDRPRLKCVFRPICTVRAGGLDAVFSLGSRNFVGYLALMNGISRLIRAALIAGVAVVLMLIPVAPASAAKGLAKGRYPCYGVISGFLTYMFFDYVSLGGTSYGTVQAKKKVVKKGKFKVAKDGSYRFTSGPLKGMYGGLLKPGPGIGLSSQPTKFYNTTCKPKK